jgi:hypothetical protein
MVLVGTRRRVSLRRRQQRGLAPRHAPPGPCGSLNASAAAVAAVASTGRRCATRCYAPQLLIHPKPASRMDARERGCGRHARVSQSGQDVFGRERQVRGDTCRSTPSCVAKHVSSHPNAIFTIISYLHDRRGALSLSLSLSLSSSFLTQRSPALLPIGHSRRNGPITTTTTTPLPLRPP